MRKEMIEFLATRNTVVIKDERDFDAFLKTLKLYGLDWILGESIEAKTYPYWQNLLANNAKPGSVPILVFEYDAEKGITFYSDVASSVDWYGREPFPVVLIY